MVDRGEYFKCYVSFPVLFGFVLGNEVMNNRNIVYRLRRSHRTDIIA